jgi:hypothetical protein
MTGAEQAVRGRALMLLKADAALAALVHGVFDGVPARASAPYVSVGAAEGSDWGTKDRAGRDDAAAGRIDAAVGGLRGAAEGWEIVAARVVRTRFAFAREGGWRHELVVRCRCLAD